MSPKKRSKKPGRPAGGGGPRTGSAGAATGTATEPGRGAAASASGVSRTPVVLDDRRRWPVAVWTALTAVWTLGSLAFFVLFLAEGFAMLGETDGGAASAGMRTAAWYLLGLVLCALAAPLAGAVWAALLRRRIAAILFAAALLLSGGALFSLDTPAGIAEAIGNGITSG
ncbi:hypothetical protein [Streptomonospora wellingtoniae]|uniref:MFS transporter n=1 Tax=Streptomonospora wellingtoniae TaxID=3075544 RepID=A0ABU2KWS5_9ACTN|nr:hypothetical protein [Streptomonospora sp. DSM 45055]MDT0303752.1 hypothetical protein [Streptomonospora sp. DSM 45055]